MFTNYFRTSVNTNFYLYMESIDNKQSTNKKEKMLERMRTKHPDSNFEDEEVLYGHISDDLDELDGEVAAMKEKERIFSDMFTSDPRSAAFLMSWKNGGDPLVELVRRFGNDGLKEMLEDPEKLEEVAQANKDYLERVAKSAELEEEFKRNLAKSVEDVDAIEGDDAKIDEAVTWLMKVGREASMGIVNTDDVKMVMKALSYDDDIQTAAHEGEVRGRNAKIDEKLKMVSGGDGLARLNGGRTMPNAPKIKNSLIRKALEA